MSKIKIVLGYILGILTTLFISCLSILLILHFTAFHKSYIIKKIEINNYYEMLQKEIIEDMKSYMISSGLSDSILNDIISVEKIKNDTNKFLTGIYSGKSNKIDNTVIRKKLNENIDKYISEYNISITNQKMLDDFVEDIINIYNDEIQLFGYTNSLSPMFYKISLLLNKIIIVCGIISIILIVILFLLKFEYIYSVISASGLILLFIGFVIKNKVDIDNIYIISETFSNILKEISNSIIHVNNITGLILFVLGICLTLLYILFKNFKKI